MPPAGRLAHSGGSINSSLSPRLSASMVRGTQCCLQEAKTEQEGKVLLAFLLELTAKPPRARAPELGYRPGLPGAPQGTSKLSHWLTLKPAEQAESLTAAPSA